jgi:hypothetical protein
MDPSFIFHIDRLGSMQFNALVSQLPVLICDGRIVFAKHSLSLNDNYIFK